MSEALYEQRPLGDAVDRHIGGGTPPRQVPSYWKGNIPWASVKDFSEQKSVILDTEEHISAAGLHVSASNLIPAQTPLVCTRMAVGRAALPVVPMAINQDVKALVPASGVSAEYLLKLMQHIQPLAEGRAVGSTVKGIRIQEYLNIPVPLAPQNAQPIIAKILDTLDTAIRESEALINKLKAIKQGLLHDLLTRGIDANGQLRPPQSEAPQLYKESPLGWVPKEWTVAGLASAVQKDRAVIRTGPFGSSLKGEHWRESGRPVVTIGSLGDGAFIESELLFIDEKTAEQLVDFELCTGDIAFSRVADVGRSVVITEEQRGWIMSSNFMRISVDSEKARPRLLQLLLASSILVRKQVRMTVNSAGRDVANSAVLMALRFPWPMPEEQDQIIERVESFERKVAMEEAQHQKLLAAKEGLMDDLLSGRVRVTSLLEAAQQVAAPIAHQPVGQPGA